MTVGKCKLTLQPGTFVKAHITPLAFTSLTVGAYFVEGGPGLRPTRRPTSWYDKQLVTRKGEDVLAELDNIAARELRLGKLVWSGWNEASELGDSLMEYPGSPHMVRLVPGLDFLRLRVFFLSLLWRAAASTMKEFQNVVLGADLLERLRLMVLNGDPFPLNLFPIQLTQLITRGPHHNLGPLCMHLPFDRGENFEPLTFKSYRFYFDGLIANIFIDIPEDLHESMSGIYLGGDESVLAMAIPYETSFQASNLAQHQHEAVQNYPQIMLKLLR
ncbi:hypothetical protein [Pseudomonas viridiflava]|uniref:hypothetical protein n=1 Tax=Pseudomonas viridiflava TaxID=33069 RepID=UPI000F013B1E|nr:hypothetical protein [Pseudomonas viridiflava]